MVTINFARVRFENENKSYIVDVNDIKIKVKKSKNRLESFNPQHAEDYNKSQWYFIKWDCNDTTCRRSKTKHFHWWKGIILCLGGKIYKFLIFM